MSNQPSQLKNQLKSQREIDPTVDYDMAEIDGFNKKSQKKRPFRNFMAILLIVLSGSYLLTRSESLLNPINWFSSTSIVSSGPSEDLLNRMSASLVEMGYPVLTHDDLRLLRRDGLTATFISEVRALGYAELTLQEAASLAKVNVTSRYIAMMIELGYTLSVEEIVMLRNAGVTAHYTSNVHDLGYRDVSPEQLIRMRRIGVSTDLITRLQQERGASVTLEEIIRYRISNQ